MVPPPSDGSQAIDLVSHTRGFLDAAVVLAQQGITFLPQSLARVYYLAFSLLRLLVWLKVGELPDRNDSHKKVWRGPHAPADARHTFGSDGLLKIRHRWDYLDPPFRREAVLADVEWVASSTEVPLGSLVDKVGEYTDRKFKNCTDNPATCPHCFDNERCARKVLGEELKGIRSAYTHYVAELRTHLPPPQEAEVRHPVEEV